MIILMSFQTSASHITRPENSQKQSIHIYDLQVTFLNSSVIITCHQRYLPYGISPFT